MQHPKEKKKKIDFFFFLHIYAQKSTKPKLIVKRKHKDCTEIRPKKNKLSLRKDQKKFRSNTTIQQE